MKRILLALACILIIGLFLLAYQSSAREKQIEQTISSLSRGEIGPEQLVQSLGMPMTDKTVNSLPDGSFNKFRAHQNKLNENTNSCKPPIRLLLISGNTTMLFGYFEDTLEFYFSGRQLCLHQRRSL